MKLTLNRLAAPALALAVTAFSGLAGAQSVPAEFRVGYQKGSAVLVLAKQKQVIEKRLKALGVSSVRWVEFQFGPPMLEALGANAIDLASVGDTPPLFAQAAGAKVVYVAATPSTEHAILVPRDSPLQKISDLKGKRVAFGKGSSAHNVTVRALQLGGLAYKDIEPVFLAPADAAAAFASKRIDAWTVWDPYYAIAEKKNDARVLVATDVPALASHSFYLSSREFATRHPAVLQAALDEIGQLIAWSAEHRDELAEIAAAETGVDLQAQRAAFRRARFEFGPVTEAVVARQQAIADTFHQLEIIPRKIAVRDIVWRAPAEALAQAARSQAAK